MATRREVMENIKECEANREFDKHVDPINWDNVQPFDETFHYIKKGFRERLKVWLDNVFVVNPFTWNINRKYKTKFLGRKNLKGIKKAIVTCNHVDMFDCLVARKALKGHKLYITAGDFNNQKGWFGDMMRSGGLMPLSENIKVMKNFNDSMQKIFEKNRYVMFYPEQAMWWHYQKPRPFKNGAFHYAVKHNVPIVPMFITFTPTDKLDEEGISIKNFSINIFEPIYANPELTKKENVEYLKNKNFEVWKQKYQEFYGVPLSYDN